MRTMSRIGAIVTGLLGVAFLVGAVVVLTAPASVEGGSKVGGALFFGVMALTMFGVAAVIWWTSNLTKSFGKPKSFRSSMADMNQAMERGSALLDATANNAQLVNRLTVEGHAGTATVSESHSTGAYINMEPVISISMLIDADGRPRYPVTKEVTVSPVDLARTEPGSVLVVRISPTDPNEVVIDWTRRPATT
jgi:hypothetical protein